MSAPDSFCFISTFSASNQLVGLLLSLSIHHKNAKVYGLVDTKTKNLLENITPKIQLQIILNVSLDKYSDKNRTIMTDEGIWDEFQMQKANVIKFALENSKDTLFLDSDILFLNPISIIDKTKDIGISPHYIKKDNTDEVGYYNGGCLWTKNKNVADDWIEFTKTSRYHDQASIEDLARKYKYQEFGEEINFMPWRILLSDNPQETVDNLNISNNELNYKDKPIVFLHTHFLDHRFTEINNMFINALKHLKRYKELAIIDRIINNKWVIKIPKQPQEGIWNHKNDSFRELALEYEKNNEDVKIESTDSGHCWLGNHILLYDRPTHEWFNQEMANASLILLGNGSIEKEGQILKQNNLNTKPWIFWPRRPALLEEFIAENKRKEFNEREIESIFIGNIENDTQGKYRNNDIKWSDILSEYHCTRGKQHRFSQEEYLEKLSNSKFGLCLRGYGSKCHREVELMSLGTIPIITPGVCIDSYMNPPIENYHYIKANNPQELLDKVKKISPKNWKEMSENCYHWYQKNVYSKNSLNTFINDILYNS